MPAGNVSGDIRRVVESTPKLPARRICFWSERTTLIACTNTPTALVNPLAKRHVRHALHWRPRTGIPVWDQDKPLTGMATIQTRTAAGRGTWQLHDSYLKHVTRAADRPGLIIPIILALMGRCYLADYRGGYTTQDGPSKFLVHARCFGEQCW